MELVSKLQNKKYWPLKKHGKCRISSWLPQIWINNIFVVSQQKNSFIHNVYFFNIIQYTKQANDKRKHRNIWRIDIVVNIVFAERNSAFSSLMLLSASFRAFDHLNLHSARKRTDGLETIIHDIQFLSNFNYRISHEHWTCDDMWLLYYPYVGGDRTRCQLACI